MELKLCPLCKGTATEYVEGTSCGCSHPECALYEPISIAEWQGRPIEYALQSELNKCEFELSKVKLKLEADEDKLEKVAEILAKMSASVITIHLEDGTIINYGEMARDGLSLIR